MYDKEGIVDRYILYLLQELAKVSNRLVVICNGGTRIKYESILKNILMMYICEMILVEMPELTKMY